MLARVRQPALKQPAKDANRARRNSPGKAPQEALHGAAQEARRLRRRRSRSDSPPQIPNRSSLASAYSRHSVWTVHVWQMRLAARVEPPFSGKKQSASLSRQAARSYQGWILTGMGPIQCLLNRCSEASGSRVTGVWNITIVITSVAFCGGLSGFSSGRFFLWTGRRGTHDPALWPVAGPWDSLTGGPRSFGGFRAGVRGRAGGGVQGWADRGGPGRGPSPRAGGRVPHLHRVRPGPVPLLHGLGGRPPPG